MDLIIYIYMLNLPKKEYWNKMCDIEIKNKQNTLKNGNFRNILKI